MLAGLAWRLSGIPPQIVFAGKRTKNLTEGGQHREVQANANKIKDGHFSFAQFL